LEKDKALFAGKEKITRKEIKGGNLCFKILTGAEYLVT